MTVADVIELVDGELCTQNAKTDIAVESGCICDLLSWVMANAKPSAAWVTVQTHMNVIAVAELLDIACVILPEGMHMDDDAQAKADEVGLCVIKSPKHAFDIAGLIYSNGVVGA